MKTKELLTTTAIALGTATLTVATFFSGALVADTIPSIPASSIAQPKLVAQGIELTATLANNRHISGGDTPAFDLHALNTLKKSVSVTVHLTMFGSAPGNPLSRALPMPTMLWQDERLLTLEANESKTTRLAPPISLPTNNVVSLLLTESEPFQGNLDSAEQTEPIQPKPTPVIGGGIVLLSFSTGEIDSSAAIASLR